jgi:hypothetical protein
MRGAWPLSACMVGGESAITLGSDRIVADQNASATASSKSWTGQHVLHQLRHERCLGRSIAVQVRLVVQRLTAIHQQLGEVVDMMGRYASAGAGTWRSGIARSTTWAGTKLMQHSGDPAHPD